jgi:hypothetical protein
MASLSDEALEKLEMTHPTEFLKQMTSSISSLHPSLLVSWAHALQAESDYLFDVLRLNNEREADQVRARARARYMARRRVMMVRMQRQQRREQAAAASRAPSPPLPPPPGWD